MANVVKTKKTKKCEFMGYLNVSKGLMHTFANQNLL